ncbi:zinc ribbon domain-containing protein [Actinomycetes bacterium KLBMP 9797]
MATYPCPSCGREIQPAPQCPHCGADQDRLAEELTKIDRAIADLKRDEVRIAKELKLNAQALQAAQFQRGILGHANRQRAQQATKSRRVVRTRIGRQSPTAAAPSGPPRVPRQPAAAAAPPPPPTPPPPPPPGEGGGQPEASPREVQNIYLGLGALLLAVAAVVFAAVAISSFGVVSRLVILLAATAIMLVAPPLIARRGLTSTAETIAGVGLMLIPLDGYALWAVSPPESVPGAVIAGVVFLVAALAAAWYGGVTGFSVPRYATVVALQPILPLLAYEWIGGPTGWALVSAGVAALNLLLTRVLAAPPRLTVPAPAPPETEPAETEPGERADRPESAPEEADAVVTPAGGPRTGARQPTVPRPAVWLQPVTWILHGVAVAAALVFAVVATVDAGTVPGAVAAGLALVLAAVIGLAGARAAGQEPLPDIAAGVLTLAVIGAAGRVLSVAVPDETLLLISIVIVLTGLGVRALPEDARRGPQLASAAALIVVGVVVAGAAVRAAIAPIEAALPVWEADLSAYQEKISTAVGDVGWQLAVSALLLTFAAVLALPPEARRESAVAGVAVAALAAPASFALPWAAAPWLPVLAAIGIGVTGLYARTPTAARAHVAGAAVVGLAGAGAALARPALTGAVLTALALAGVLIATAASWLVEQVDALRDEPAPAQLVRVGPAAGLVGDWAAGGAAFALPGAVAATVAAITAVPGEPPAAVPVLAAAFVAVCGTLGYAAMAQVAWRRISLPLTAGTGLGAFAVTAAAFGAPGASAWDAWVGALLLIGAVLLILAPSIDAGRRSDRVLDGADYAAAAATAGLIGTFARIAQMLFPDAILAVGALIILLVAVGVRAMPPEWRRGPVLGVAVSGAVIGVIAGYTALSGGLRVLATPGALWAADLSAWPAGDVGLGWQAPVALALLAGAAAIVLPRPWSYNVAGFCVGLATIGAPLALGLPWWSPMLVGGAVATVYGVAAVLAADPRAGLARTAVAAGVALHAVGASLVRPWTTAAALAMVTLVGLLVAALARLQWDVDGADMPPHLGQIGGLAAGGALLALPGALAAIAAEGGATASGVLSSALVGTGIGLALIAVTRRQVPRYLPHATVGIAGGATITAIASVPTGLSTGVYAAAAALAGVIAELLRGATPAPEAIVVPPQRWSVRLGGAWRRTEPVEGVGGRWSVNPAMGALLAAAVPTALALVGIAPLLVDALVDPHLTVYQIWEGPPAALTEVRPAADPTDVLAALLLTIAAAFAAIGFGGGRPSRAIPVVLPGAAITLLIAPLSLGADWPAATMAALAVFTLSMLGLAITAPPAPAERARPLRITRVVVFVIGLAAGGAGLAGSLAEQPLTLFTLGGAVAVGATAAVVGQTQRARILGWLFAAVSAEGFVLTAALIAGLEPEWSAFGVLAVGAALLVVAATLPRLRRPEAYREAATVEWSGYAAALIALALAYDSPRHVAALLAAWGAVLGLASTRPGRQAVERRILFWTGIACELVAWWLLMGISDVGVPEAYTLPFAALALLIGAVELRQRRALPPEAGQPDLSSWTAYGPALVAAFVPTLVIALTSDSRTRDAALLLGAVVVLTFGARTRQQAPLVVGSVVTVLTALHALTAAGLSWVILIPVGALLMLFGATSESRRRTQERFRAVTRMR